MNYTFYLQEFKSAISKCNQKDFDSQDIQLFAGIVLDSVAFKAYKPGWASDPENPLSSDGRIFFSVWVNEKSIKEERLYYNIHALKLRELKEYKIASRHFAERFRNNFKSHQNNWMNVSTNYGPQTLMQGWQKLKIDTIQNDVIQLASEFLKISPLIDKTLNDFKIR